MSHRWNLNGGGKVVKGLRDFMTGSLFATWGLSGWLNAVGDNFDWIVDPYGKEPYEFDSITKRKQICSTDNSSAPPEDITLTRSILKVLTIPICAVPVLLGACGQQFFHSFPNGGPEEPDYEWNHAMRTWVLTGASLVIGWPALAGIVYSGIGAAAAATPPGQLILAGVAMTVTVFALCILYDYVRDKHKSKDMFDYLYPKRFEFRSLIC